MCGSVPWPGEQCAEELLDLADDALLLAMAQAMLAQRSVEWSPGRGLAWDELALEGQAAYLADARAALAVVRDSETPITLATRLVNHEQARLMSPGWRWGIGVPGSGFVEVSRDAP